MEGIIASFRRGRRTQTPNQAILEVTGNLNDFIGKNVEWTSPAKKTIAGKITSLHGKAKVKAKFETGLPGQAIGQKVKIF